MSSSWYPDPATPGQLRWWDGQQWTGHVQPAFAVPNFAFGGDPGADLTSETKAGKTASTALVAGAAVYVAQYVMGAFVYGRLSHTFRNWFRDATRHDGTVRRLTLPRGYFVWNSLLQLCSLGILAAGVLFLIWFYQAATFAQKAGLPARRSTGWAVAGFIVPIINLWFPYQTAMDLFPPGHPGRRLVKRWWGLWLTISLGAIFVLLASIFSTALGLLLGVALGGVAVAAAMAGRRLIAEVGRAHADLIGR